MIRIRPDRSWPLHGLAASRELEALSQANLPPHTLMQRAGLSTARLARAIAPHARQVWIACGPGNNGGDGFEAAHHLHQWGCKVTLTWAGGPGSPADAQASRQKALNSGLQISTEPPGQFDLAIDAMLGLGGDLSPERPATALMLNWLGRMYASGQPVLAIDLPTGLQADTGTSAAPLLGAGPRHTLSLLSLKPGLFTAQGRDHAGEVWFDSLQADGSLVTPTAWLLGADRAGPASKAGERHASHKGSFGDVVVVGGQQAGGIATSMAGAALLAARAALHAGAGRVYVTLLGQPDLRLDVVQPELMFRPQESLAALDRQQVVVAGCGGGTAIADVLPALLQAASRLVLDADALNAIAGDQALRQQLAGRAAAGASTVLTPHPLEAARLLSCSAGDIQGDRLGAAQELAGMLGCTVILKGSGSVVASPGQTPWINHSGNALLATAGTGDVLAGMVGAAWARSGDALRAALHAVQAHGAKADAWAQARPREALCASDLIKA